MFVDMYRSNDVVQYN